MTTTIALAAPGLAVETQVLAGALSHGFDVRRRCVDAADLLGACLGAPGLVAVLTADLPRVSAEVIDRLRACGSQVIGIALAPDDRVALVSLGIESIIECDDDAQHLLADIAGALTGDHASSGVWVVQPTAQPEPVAEKGRLIAVWGPAGAPGRTTTALVLAQCMSERAPTVIIDADTSAPSVALQLGLADDLSGLIMACRHADAGSLSSRALRSSMCQMGDHYFALTGVTHARRGAELRPAALMRVLEGVRSHVSYAVIDLSSALDNDHSGAASPAAVTECAMSVADVVVAVCRAEPLGVARFLSELPCLAAAAVPVVAVLTAGTHRDQARQLIRESAERLGMSIPVVDLPLDPRALSRASRKAQSLRPRRRITRGRDATARLVELVA